MITASAIIFILVFVALGARPYRVSERLPAPQEDHLDSAGAYTELYAKLKACTCNKQPVEATYVTREAADVYFQKQSVVPLGVLVVDATPKAPDPDLLLDLELAEMRRRQRHAEQQQKLAKLRIQLAEYKKQLSLN